MLEVKFIFGTFVEPVLIIDNILLEIVEDVKVIGLVKALPGK